MRGLDRLFLLLIAVLLVAGCGKDSVRAGRVKEHRSLAPEYSVRDDAQTRKRMKYDELLSVAGDRFSRGDLDESFKFARSAQKLDGSRPDAFTALALIAAQRGQVEEAGALYRKAADLAPNHGDVLNNYGAWLCSHGHPAEALIWFDRALADANYGSRAEALANAGGCALDAGQNERAEESLRRALEMVPNNPYALESMARNEVLHGRYFEARAFYQRRLAAAPATVSVLQLAIQIEERLGDRSAVGRFQQRLREEFPSDAASKSQG